jgi:hypothetical protein
MPGNPESGPREPEGRQTVEELIAPFFTDSSLWPVLIVVMGGLATLGAAVLIGAIYYRNLLAAAALLGIAWIAFDVVKRHRRQQGDIGRLGWTIVALWLLSAAIAIGAALLGVA